MSLIPIAKNLYKSGPDGAVLIGARDLSSRQVSFPVGSVSDLDGKELVEISGVGKLWTYTVQRFKPKPPFLHSKPDSEFVPYIVAYVEFEEYGVIVEGRVVNAHPESLSIGQAMSITTEIVSEVEGSSVEIFAFSPKVER